MAPPDPPKIFANWRKTILRDFSEEVVSVQAGTPIIPTGEVFHSLAVRKEVYIRLFQNVPGDGTKDDGGSAPFSWGRANVHQLQHVLRATAHTISKNFPDKTNPTKA
ncbi:MAG: hypothetical protein AAGA63_12080 [Pseudomonadota bacterium]